MWGSAQATPPHIQILGFFLSLLLLLPSRATESSWLLCPMALLLQQPGGRSSLALCAPEVLACQEASPGTRENVSLLWAPWGCGPGCRCWRQGGESSARGGLQLDEEEGSFHLLLLGLLSHFLQGGRACPCQGPVSDLSAQECKRQQRWAEVTRWPHGSTNSNSLRMQMTSLQPRWGDLQEAKGSGMILGCHGPGLCTHFLESQKQTDQWRRTWDREVGRDGQGWASRTLCHTGFPFPHCSPPHI